MIEYENLKKSNNFFIKKFETTFKKFCNDGKYILSKNVLNFEKKFSNFLSAKYCTGVGNGLDALVMSLKALNLEKGSEVILPANTYYATLLAVLRCNLRPVLVEPDLLTYNIDYKAIEKKLTKKTKVILVVHLYGKSCQMDKILEICNKNNIFLIEDCAQSHGAKFKNKFTGTFGIFGCFSFYPTKNLGCLGDGGAVLTNSYTYDRTIKMLRNYGSIKRYQNEILGINSRLDELQAAFLNLKLNYLNKINKHKIRLATIYNKNLNKKFIKPFKSEDFFDVYYVYTIRHPKRDLLREYLKREKIFTDIHYPVPPYRQKAVSHLFKNKDYPISEEIHKTTLSLPISYMTTIKNVKYICKILNKF